VRGADQSADAEAAALAAIVRSRDAGFHFLHLRAEGEIAAIHAERWRGGAVDSYLVRAAREAYAARFRAEDYGRSGGGPLWHTIGTAADVITELLALPAHGTPGAPVLALRAPSELWLPGR
jgi:hypothetical protein